MAPSALPLACRCLSGPGENGTIDAAEFICPHDDERLGIANLAKFNYHPRWWESSGMVHLLVNLERWNALPKPYRAILARACDAANAWMLARYDSLNPPALKRLVDAGVILKSFPQPVLEACLKATHEHFGELAAKDAHFKKAYDSVNTFRRLRAMVADAEHPTKPSRSAGDVSRANSRGEVLSNARQQSTSHPAAPRSAEIWLRARKRVSIMKARWC